MPLRRLWAVIPLAVLVAELAHVAGFGQAHLPGGDHAGSLFVWLAVALVALALAALVRALVATPSRPRTPIGEARTSVGLLASFALVAFAAIEIAEGHGVFGGGLRPLLAILPLAFLVSRFSRRVDRAIMRVAATIVAYARRSRIGSAGGHLARSHVRLETCGRIARRVARGRAPPQFA